ncbi:MAG: hypothetical protein V1493_03165 [Candidatus Diapherotrites archaeon]
MIMLLVAMKGRTGTGRGRPRARTVENKIPARELVVREPNRHLFRERDLMVRPLGEAECSGILGQIRRNAGKHQGNLRWLEENNPLYFKAYQNYAGETHVAKFSGNTPRKRVISIANFAHGKVEEQASGKIEVLGNIHQHTGIESLILSDSVYIDKTYKNSRLLREEPGRTAGPKVREIKRTLVEEAKGRFLFRVFLEEAIRLANANGLKKNNRASDIKRIRKISGGKVRLQAG